MIFVALLSFLLVTSVSSVHVQEGVNDDRPTEDGADEETADQPVVSVEVQDVDAVDLKDLFELMDETSAQIEELIERRSSEATAKLQQALQYNAKGNVLRHPFVNATVISHNWKELDVPPQSTFITTAQRIITALKAREEFCRVKYQKRCFWIEFRHEVGMTCGEARYICALNGGILAYVYSPEHLEILQGYLRTFIVRQNHVANPGVYSWVGLRYSSKILTVLADGRLAPYTVWEAVAHNQCVVIKTTERWSDESRGFYERAHTDTAESVICEVVV